MPLLARSPASRLPFLSPLLFALSALAAPPASAAVSVSGNLATPTFIASLSAGQTYTITASGVVDLYNGFNGGAGLTFTADGKPTYAFPSPYAAFGPDGSTTDPTNGSHGPAYDANVGALVGTFSANPVGGAGSTSFFLIGLGTTLTTASDLTLYGLVNDTDYRDNGPGAFSVDVVQASAVPEPASAGLLALGALMLLGRRARFLRRR
jgi:hypothetical protein